MLHASLGAAADHRRCAQTVARHTPCRHDCTPPLHALSGCRTSATQARPSLRSTTQRYRGAASTRDGPLIPSPCAREMLYRELDPLSMTPSSPSDEISSGSTRARRCICSCRSSVLASKPHDGSDPVRSGLPSSIVLALALPDEAATCNSRQAPVGADGAVFFDGRDSVVLVMNGTIHKVRTRMR